MRDTDSEGLALDRTRRVRQAVRWYSGSRPGCAAGGGKGRPHAQLGWHMSELSGLLADLAHRTEQMQVRL